MYFTHVSSPIINWWICKANYYYLSFCNILDPCILNEQLLVVGYMDDNFIDLAKSSSYVKQITPDGVYTANGTFYSFYTAHEMYLQFLIDANKPNTFIAYQWDFASKDEKWIVATFHDGNLKKELLFDFVPTSKTKALLTGYSPKLNANIVLSSFSRKHVFCPKLFISDIVKDDIKRSSYTTADECLTRLNQVHSLIPNPKKILP